MRSAPARRLMDGMTHPFKDVFNVRRKELPLTAAMFLFFFLKVLALDDLLILLD